MNSKERVKAAILHQKPDRTPRDFWAETPTLNRLFDHVGYNDEDRLLRQLDIDIRHLDAKAPQDREVEPGIYQNFWGERYIKKQTPWGQMPEAVPGALARAATFKDLQNFNWPDVEDFDYSGLPEMCDRYRDYSLLYGFADIWQRPALVRGWQGMFLDMTEHPEWVHFLARTFTDFYIRDYTKAAEVTNGQIDIYLLISDLGSQSGPLISPAMFREFIAPYIKEMTEHIHSLGAFVLYHSCGAIYPFINDLIELGIDVLDPIQPTGPEMSPENLKNNFGDRLTFHGGIDMQKLLPTGTPQQIARQARRYCQTIGKEGGYILAPAHFFQPDVPPQNIMALYQMIE